MGRFRFLVSLITKDNDFQMEQAAAAKAAAGQLGVDVEIVYAENDAITQSTQLLKAIQVDQSLRPNAIVVEPLGATTFAKVASTAVAAGVGWAVLSRKVDCESDPGSGARIPIFGVSTNQIEVGRLQAKQIARLRPGGGTVLFIQGPSVSSVSRERTEGLRESIPSNIQLVNLRGKWTEDSAYSSVSSWVTLMKSRKLPIDLICAQNDSMAMGARKALKDAVTDWDRNALAAMPVIGCDGVPNTGQAWVRAGHMTATVITPPNAGTAVTLMCQALRNQTLPAKHTYLPAEPFPSLDSLAPR